MEFTLRVPRYNDAEYLHGTMVEFGRHTLKYDPPDESSTDHSVEMSISSEATLAQMLEFFSSFLRAVGYEFEGKELCFERIAPDLGDVSEKWWGDDPGYWKTRYEELVDSLE
jgi:hypothetical protein